MTTTTTTTTETTATLERATEPQHGSVVHFEFTTPNLEQAKPFYATVFGWEFQPFQATEWYFMTPGNWGPCGCVIQGPASTEARTMIYVNVKDIAQTLAKATKLGATTTRAKTEIPGGHGWFAHMKAPDGNTWGLFTRA